MKNSIGSQLGYTSTDELRQKHNGTLELSNVMDIHEVINRLLYDKIIFSISYNLNNSNTIIKF